MLLMQPWQRGGLMSKQHRKPLRALRSRAPYDRPGLPSALAAAMFVLGWAMFIVFVALYRLPLPDEAFVHAAARLGIDTTASIER
jgi:hypothetical protein